VIVYAEPRRGKTRAQWEFWSLHPVAIKCVEDMRNITGMIAGSEQRLSMHVQKLTGYFVALKRRAVYSKALRISGYFFLIVSFLCNHAFMQSSSSYAFIVLLCGHHAIEVA
jgi:hypothetical protein